MKILHLSAKSTDAQVVYRTVATGIPGATVVHCISAEQFATVVMTGKTEIVLVDETVPGMGAVAAIELVRQAAPAVAVIVLSDANDADRALKAIRAGADDYLLKSRLAELPEAIKRALDHRKDVNRSREIESQFEAETQLLEQAIDAIVVEDPSGRIRVWNQAAINMLGWSADEAIGKTLSFFGGPDAAATLAAAAKETAEKGGWRGEVQFRGKDGRTVVLDLRRTLVRDRKGGHLEQLSIGRDLTERRELEEQLFRSQRLEGISLLAAGIAHDLNNILSPIGTALGLLKQDIKDPGRIRVMATLEKSVDRGTGLVRQLVAYVHGTEGVAKPQRVTDAVREIGALIRDTFLTEIDFIEDIPEDNWLVKMEGTHLHQILLNLAVNARDAMPDGGRLKISLENVTLDRESVKLCPRGRPGDFVMISVSDTGTGIPPEAQNRVWEPFYSTKPTGKGTGLGLSTVRGIVSRYHGFAELDSVYGSGTCFRIYLPAVIDDADPDNHGAGPVALPGKDGWVLVMDGSQDVRRLVASVLQRYHIHSVTVDDGLEGAVIFQKDPNKFSVVISDLEVPGLNGRRLETALLKVNPRVQFVFTGSGDPGEDSPQGRYLAKPFQPSELLAVVASALSEATSEVFAPSYESVT